MRTMLAFLLGLLATSANAATIKYIETQSGVNFVGIRGEIVAGDSARFRQVTAALSGTTVVFLASPGGLVGEGLAIGAAIRIAGFQTMVPDDEVCASVCGMIWLAGTQRFLSEHSRVGFHAAYREDGSESGQGNAIVGAYLTQLGFALPTIIYVTKSPPNDMNWLHPSDASRVGITYSLIPSEQKSQTFIPSAPQPPSAPAAVTPTLSPAAQQAIHLVANYHTYWSQGGADVEDLARYYAPTVTYYGNAVSREKVMGEKRKFSARWPIRHYTINQTSLFVQCDADGTCIVTGIVTWDCTSQERGAHSVGTANFAVRIANGVIISESGSVLTAHNDTVEQQQATATPVYAQGRQARIDYEQWYTGLPEGPFKEGVTFWATHRGDKPRPPNCTSGVLPWEAGCLAAMDRLRPIDQRRTTEKDFWFGWNSL